MADFERKLTELESVVERLERGDLSLEESVRLFEEGMKLSDSCKRDLETAEGRIQMLVSPDSKNERVVALELDSVDEEEQEE